MRQAGRYLPATASLPSGCCHHFLRHPCCTPGTGHGGDHGTWQRTQLPRAIKRRAGPRTPTGSRSGSL
ncbi:uroporphyrinogen decarboxylase [Homo sapiens]|uniref:Uroporphyrinogen decarboxylase n=1 Tax=Homo sapiens TaxID=9606 RepID=A0A494BZV1_HUMAN|nr:uroporphyrinogen decarboxylase [Homo sapiens]KAI4080387.1 uroporphyrinogen decarboxylase [Homo sapiens]